MADDIVIRISAKELAAKAFKDTGKRVDTLESKLDGFSRRAKSIGGGMTKFVIAPILGIGAAVLKVGIDYDNALKAMSVSTGATGQDLAGLGDVFTGVFATVTDDATLVATAIGDINTITGASGPVLEAMMHQVLDASRALGEDAAPNAKGFANALVQFQRPASEGADILLDRIFKVSQDTGAGLGKLIGDTNTYGAVLQNAGFTLEESVVLFGRLNKTGIETSRIMPGLNTAFRKWADAGKDSREELQRVILRMREARTDTEALKIATAAFGAEGAQRMTTAVRNGSFALEDLTASLEGAQGVIAETTEANRPLREEFTLLWREISVELMPVGRQLVETLRELKSTFKAVAEDVAGLVRWFADLDPKAQSLIRTSLLLVSAVGPVVGGFGWAVGALTPLLAPLAGGLTGAGAAAGRKRLATAVVARRRRRNRQEQGGPPVRPKQDLATTEQGGDREEGRTEIEFVGQQLHVGPLPSPEMLARFGTVLPDLPARIVTMAEGNATDRWRNNRANRVGGILGLVFAFVIVMTALLGGFYIVSQGYDVAGIAAIVTAIGAPLGVFVYNRLNARD